MLPFEEDDSRAPFPGSGWLIGPPWLAGLVGLLVGAAVTAISLLLLFSQFGLPQSGLTLLAGGCAGAGAIVGSMGARDWFLREDWAMRRWLIGLLMGAALGAVLALHVYDWLVVLGGTLGGALGGLVDAVVHGDILEES